MPPLVPPERDQWNAWVGLQPGPELDAVVAEKVMGWKKFCNLDDGPKGRPLDCWHKWSAADHKLYRETGIKPLGGGSECVEYQSTENLEHGGWSPSRDIAAAYSVLCHFNGWSWSIHNSPEYGCTVQLIPPGKADVPGKTPTGRAGHDEIALAICRAALWAVTAPRYM